VSRRVQQQARALGDPTRYAIFQFVGDSGAPVRVAALTQHFGMNHNAIRQHLAKLGDAGLVVEEVAARSGPGRPALQYRLAAGVPGTWDAQGPYEDLAVLLLEILADGRPARDVGRAAGKRAAASAAGVTTVDRLCGEMQRRGFEPHVVEHDAGDAELLLGRCPFITAATAQPDVVCEIHRGLAEGFVEGAGFEVHLTVRAPSDGGCRIQLSSATAAVP
jgi:predicted ArsR family transcriptional regulator